MPGGRGGPDQFLTTVLMTDIVGSTDHAAELGDAAWRDLVAQHHRVVRAALRRYHGRELDTAGDGFFATFDAPADAVACALDIAGEVSQRVASTAGTVTRIDRGTNSVTSTVDLGGSLAAIVSL